MTYNSNTQQQPQSVQPAGAARPAQSNQARLAMESRRAPALAALRQRWNSGTVEQENNKVVKQENNKVVEQVRPTSPPGWAQKRTTVGTKARGYAFEKKVGKLLTKWCEESGWKLWDHQWFVYTCNEEVKYFQPDFIIERPGAEGVVIEVKLTYVDTSLQLNKYLKYLSIFGITCFPTTIVRNLTPSTVKVIDDFNKISPDSVLHLWI